VRESGSAHPRIQIRSSRDGNGIKLEVLDNGVGITSPNLSKVFNHGFTTKRHGHGFGLHNSANAAQHLEGSLTASSDGDGKGARFTLRLPAEFEDDDPLRGSAALASERAMR
jgi:signal transduction histidine kinase